MYQRLIAIILSLCLLNVFQLQPAFAVELDQDVFRLSQQPTPDPLEGLNLKKLEDERLRLSAAKRDPGIAMALSVVPGAGHFYSDQSDRGAFVIGGFLGTLLVSFLASTLVASANTDPAKIAATVINIAPPFAFMGWSITDAYYQTEIKNLMLDNRIKELTLKQNEYGYYSKTIFKANF